MTLLQRFPSNSFSSLNPCFFPLFLSFSFGYIREKVFRYMGKGTEKGKEEKYMVYIEGRVWMFLFFRKGGETLCVYPRDEKPG